MDERPFLEQVRQLIAEFLAGQRPFAELVTGIVLPGWEAQQLGPAADDVVAEVEALAVWRSEWVLDEEEMRAALRALLERVERSLDAGAASVPLGR
ncbi:hypothetical protein HRbin28_01773 [bacterium HR28]|nr:hypothetical protein HRbin28_01773 [bacterium HR28]